MKLRDANLQVNEKNSLSHYPSGILPLFFQNTPDYFSRKAFESDPAQFLSGIISGK